ncbi:hypothetical protein OC842_007272 [Tilletia horrida]|uniref:Uncharacterized protein n=1 Tax=Tilletia horrida TaxID=155126 RepID=A0AAN6G4I2_9BASI|nr:hypothetical protein OC842_007272 [Tilletia horrida]
MHEGLRKRFAHIGGGVRNGFSVGALQLPSTTVLAPRHFKAEHLPVIVAWKDKALADGFAAGPFRREDIERNIGPFVCVPITVVYTAATATKAEKHRVCFNASWAPSEGPVTTTLTSINDEVRDEPWECEWFLVTEVKIQDRTGTAVGRHPSLRDPSSRRRKALFGVTAGLSPVSWPLVGHGPMAYGPLWGVAGPGSSPSPSPSAPDLGRRLELSLGLALPRHGSSPSSVSVLRGAMRRSAARRPPSLPNGQRMSSAPAV